MQNSSDGVALRAGLAVKGGAALASRRFAPALDRIYLMALRALLTTCCTALSWLMPDGAVDSFVNLD